METSNTDLQTALTHIEGVVAKATAHVENGDLVDLAGLDVGVKDVCDRILTLSMAEAAPFREGLARLAENLDHLKELLQKAQAGVKEQLEGLNVRQKAVKAYQTTSAQRNTVTADDAEDKG